jgi:endoglucanase
MTIQIGCGTNISHWLSQSDRRGDARRAFFTRGDVRRLADWGFNHLRLPIDEEQMWDAAGRPEAEAFDLLDAALDWAQAAGLKAVVDLHILRSHHFISEIEPKLFTDPAAADHFADLWRQLSARLQRRANDCVAYELMNEAVATDPADWNRVAMLAFQAIRKLEPHRTIVLGSNRWNSALTFDQLQIPDDGETVLTFHYYLPMLITHHRANWWPEGMLYDGPLQYPGQPIPAANLAGMAEPARSRLTALNQPYDRAHMAADLAQPLAAAARTGLPLYCGEFGVYSQAPQPVRFAWYRDAISVFSEHGIAWANWDYKGGFALMDAQGRSTGIAEVMLGTGRPCPRASHHPHAA